MSRGGLVLGGSPAMRVCHLWCDKWTALRVVTCRAMSGPLSCNVKPISLEAVCLALTPSLCRVPPLHFCLCLSGEERARHRPISATSHLGKKPRPVHFRIRTGQKRLAGDKELCVPCRQFVACACANQVRSRRSSLASEFPRKC